MPSSLGNLGSGCRPHMHRVLLRHSQGGQGGGSPMNMTHVRVASGFEIHPFPQCMQLVRQPGCVGLGVGPPRQVLRAILRVETGQVPEEVAGPYNSEARKGWETALAGSAVQIAEVAEAVDAISYTHQGSSSSYLNMRLKPSARPPLIDKWEREGLLVNGQRLRVGHQYEQQPPGTTRVLVMHLPGEFGVCGIVSTLLTCAGYSGAEGMVAQEFLGFYKAGGTVVPGMGNMDYIVAFVHPPADDPLLVRLPETFYIPGSPPQKVVVTVDGRKPTSMHRPVPVEVLSQRLASGQPPPRVPANQPPPPPRPSPTPIGGGVPGHTSPSAVAASVSAWSNPSWHRTIPLGGSPGAPFGAPQGPQLRVPMEVDSHSSMGMASDQPVPPAMPPADEGPTPMDDVVAAPQAPSVAPVGPMDRDSPAPVDPGPSRVPTSGQMCSSGPSSLTAPPGSTSKVRKAKGTVNLQQQQQPPCQGAPLPGSLPGPATGAGPSTPGSSEPLPAWLTDFLSQTSEEEQFRVWSTCSTFYDTFASVAVDLRPEGWRAKVRQFFSAHRSAIRGAEKQQLNPVTENQLPRFALEWIRVHMDTGSYEAALEPDIAPVPAAVPARGKRQSRRKRQQAAEEQHQQQLGRGRSRSRSGGTPPPPRRSSRSSRPPGEWFRVDAHTRSPPRGGSR